MLINNNNKALAYIADSKKVDGTEQVMTSHHFLSRCQPASRPSCNLASFTANQFPAAFHIKIPPSLQPMGISQRNTEWILT